MPEGIDYGDMMRQLDKEDRAAIETDARAALEEVARRITAEVGVPAYAHRDAIWIRVRDEYAVRALRGTASSELRRAIRTAGDVSVYGIEDAEAWKWDLGHVAMARAHGELCAAFVSPLRRQARRLERFARGTR